MAPETFPLASWDTLLPPLLLCPRTPTLMGCTTGSLALWLWLGSGEGTPLQEIRRTEESAARVSSPHRRWLCPWTVTTGPARGPSPDSGSNHSLLFLLLLRDGHSPHVLLAPGYCTILCGVLMPPPHLHRTLLRLPCWSLLPAETSL